MPFAARACLKPAIAPSSAGCVTIWVTPMWYTFALALALEVEVEPLLEPLPQPATTVRMANASAVGTRSLVAKRMILLSAYE